MLRRVAPLVTVEALLTDDILDRAYAWLCHRRRRFPDAADVWSFRRDWSRERVRLRAKLRAGTYRFGLLSRVTLKTGEDVDIWPACRPSLIPTPAKPMPSPRFLVLAATSW